MICPHCGENNPDNSKYCTRCSATLSRKQRPAGPGAPAPSGSSSAPKIILLILLVLVVLGGGIFLVKSLLIKDDDTVEEETEEEETSEEETETEEETEEATEEETEEAATTDWFDDNGLSATSAGSFTFDTMMNDGEDDTDETEVSAKVTITQTTENAPDGYKIVTATFIYDVSDSDGEQGILADGAFDRYTGTYFGFENEQPETEDEDEDDDDSSSNGNSKEEESREGFVKITNGSDDYYIAVVSDQKTEEPMITKTISIICPNDYDGAVFFSGYSSLEMDKDLKELDPAERLYTFDELPFMDNGHDCYYFIYETPDDNGKSSWGSYEVKEEPSEEAVETIEPQRR